MDVDGTKFNLWNNVGDDSTWPANICGDAGKNDLGAVTLRAKIFHSASTLTLKFYGGFSIDSDNESFGMRDLKITFAYKAPAETEGFCGYSTGGTPLNMGNCDCPDGQYDNGGCTACDAACETCFGGTSEDCYTCASGYVSINNECVLPCGDYVYTNNNTCIAGCSSPFTANTVNSINTCDFACSAGEYLYPDDVCRATCPTPYVTTDHGGALYCDSPCAAGQHLYWNDDCEATCPSPLTSSSPEGIDLCDFGCTSGEYLYWDGSCEATCPA